MGCFHINTSIFVPSSREGLTSAACPVFIFLSLSRPLSGPESPALWARGPGRDAAAPGTFIVESRDLGFEDKITKVLRKYSTAEDGDYQKNYTPDLLNTKLDLLCEHWWGNEK